MADLLLACPRLLGEDEERFEAATKPAVHALGEALDSLGQAHGVHDVRQAAGGVVAALPKRIARALSTCGAAASRH